MAFNSAALSAGIGSMLQGIQQNAQQKLQLAQMERQQRIEDKRLAEEQLMNDLNRQMAAENLRQAKVVNPITADDLALRRDLTRGMMPFQLDMARLGVKGQEQGLIGQGLANDAARYNNMFMLPEQYKGLQADVRSRTAGARLAEGTVEPNITLANQGVQANKFGAVTAQETAFNDALKQIRSAQTVLNDRTASKKDQDLAYREYQIAAQTLNSFPSKLRVMMDPQFKDLFGDTSNLRAAAIRGLGGTPEQIADPNFDMSGLIGRFAPRISAPSLLNTADILPWIQSHIAGTMGSSAMSPNEAFIDRVEPGFNDQGILTGPYKPSEVNVGKLAKFSYPQFKERLRLTATQQGMKVSDVWQRMGLNPADLDNTGQPRMGNKDVAERVYRAMGTFYSQPQGLDTSLGNYEARHLDVLKNKVSGNIAAMQKAVGIKQTEAQLEASLKQMAYPAIANYQELFNGGVKRQDKIKAQLASLGVPDKLMTIATAWSEVAEKIDQRNREQGKILHDELRALQTGMQDASDAFIDKEQPDAAIRATNAIKKLLGLGLTSTPTINTQGTTGAKGGAAAAKQPPSGFGVSGNLKFNAPQFGDPGPAPPP